MAVKTYGKPPNSSQNENPTHGRSTSLEYCYKKAMYYDFMPLRRLSTWNVMTNCENPTRSVLVLDLIKDLKKKDRKQGKASEARRPLKAQECTNTINALQRCKDSIRRFQMVSLCSFQFHMVGRILLSNYQLHDSWDKHVP